MFMLGGIKSNDQRLDHNPDLEALYESGWRVD
jgi:hypothetical protein